MKKYILSKIVEHTIDLFECIRIHCTCICSPQHNSCLDQVDVKTRLRCYEVKQRKDSNSWHEPPMHCIHCICSTKLHIYDPLANQQSISTVPSISTADEACEWHNCTRLRLVQLIWLTIPTMAFFLFSLSLSSSPFPHTALK